MASNVDFFVAFLLGILPGLAILWVSLRRFDRPQVDHTLFDDRRVFGSLAVGLIFGTVASIFALALPRGDLAPFLLQVDEPYGAIAAVTSVGFALLIYYYVYREILPGTLPEDIRRELRRERRRAPAVRD